MKNQIRLGENISILVGLAVLLFTFVSIGITSSKAEIDIPNLDTFESIDMVEEKPVQIELVLEDVYLPIVHRILPPEITKDYPIWAHASEPLKHEVVLFRCTFSLEDVLEKAELHIFGDTRYEIWFDGQWIGRGPARFSFMTREFDVYQLEGLDQGEHLIAVLVQWAPNNRRSESTTPYLQAHMQGENSNQTHIVARTDSQWKAYFTDAWNQNAAPVHSWGLIGPTELLDFRKLPIDWMKSGFNDGDWPPAAIKEISIQVDQLRIPRLDSSIQSLSDIPDGINADQLEVELNKGVYRPRSIEFLDNVLMPINLMDHGLLSPDQSIGEIMPEASHSLKFEAISSTPFMIEILADNYPSSVVLLDGYELDWIEAGPQRPDVYSATVNISSGTHKLSFNAVPETGFTFSISTKNINTKNFPFHQGSTAGRRLLLAEPVSDQNSVNINSEGNLTLKFNAVPSYAVFDLGRTVYGRFSATVSGPAGAFVDIGWDERLLDNTLRPLPYPGSLHPQWNQSDSWILDGTKRVVSTIDARAGRYILIAAWGSGPIELTDINVHEERYPLTQIGEFNSPDSMLNKVWQLGVDTLYPNMSDAYSDPWRERGQWWGDAYVVEKVNRVVFGERDLLKRGIGLMSEAFTNGRPNAMAPNGYGNHMLDYGMLWVHSLQEYVQLTGDTSILKESYQTMASFLDYLKGYENINTGLLDIPFGSWAQTVYIDSIGWKSRYGQSTAVNAMYYSTLLQAANIGDVIGDSTSSENWRKIAEKVKEAINSNLYLGDEHRYVSSNYEGEIVQPTTHAQAFALAYEIVPTEDVQLVAGSLLDLISNDPSVPDFEVYGTYWVLEALGRAGLIDEALQIIKTYHGYWLDLGASTTWEIYNADQSYSQSLSHGWGSSPTWFLSTYLLGARQEGPNSWSVKSSFSDLGNLQGSIPLSNGSLQIDWEQKSCEEIELTISSPEDSNGTIWLDNVGRDYELTLNGSSIWNGTTSLVEWINVDPQFIQIPVVGGNQNLSFHRDC